MTVNQSIEKLVTQVGKRYSPDNRFLMGLTLGRIYGQHGKESFTRNCLALGFSTNELAALLTYFELHNQ